MRSHRRVAIVAVSTLALSFSLAQNGGTSKQAQKQTIRIGIALMSNRSGRPATPTWERDQLVREIQRVRMDRKSAIILEPVSLDAISLEDAGPEAARKDCRYFVLTTMVDPRRGPGMSGGPDGIAPAPVMIGNAKASSNLAIDYAIFPIDDVRPVHEGTATAAVEENNATRAADEAMRLVAHQVASRLRQSSAPKID